MPFEDSKLPAWLTRTPLLLASNRVYRSYTGGALLDALQGAPHPADTHFPEEWVGSTTMSRLPGRPPEEGLSQVLIGDGRTVSLKSVIDAYPDAMLGPRHVAQYGPNLAVLCKLLDSAMRLSIQAHPDRAFARRHLRSPFGKTESWIVLGTREIAGEAPYLLFAFREGVTETEFRRMTELQDTSAQIAALNRIAVRPGDVYFVPAGVPHAIGPGVFMVEVQEPTDFTINVEYTVAGVRRTETQCFLGLGADVGMQCFDYGAIGEACVQGNTLDPRVVHESAGSREDLLIGPEHSQYFGASRLVIREAGLIGDGTCAIGIITKGRGRMISSTEPTIPLRPGSTFFLPAAAGPQTIQADPDSPLTLIQCFPPGHPPRMRPGSGL